MYFSLNQLRQCKFLINAVEGPGFPALEPPPAGASGSTGVRVAASAPPDPPPPLPPREAAAPPPPFYCAASADHPPARLPLALVQRGYSGFPTAQLVTYRYYTGLLALYDEDYGRGACSAPCPRPV